MKAPERGHEARLARTLLVLVPVAPDCSCPCSDGLAVRAALDGRLFDLAGLDAATPASWDFPEAARVRLGTCFFSLALGKRGFAVLPPDSAFSSGDILPSSAFVLLLASSKGFGVLARSDFATSHDSRRASGHVA